MKSNKTVYLWLHLLLAIYSLSSVCSKMAAGEEFLSVQWILYYGLLIGLLGIYAIGWQQMIKRMPLTAAYANKAVTVVWGCVYGVLFFKETITVGKLVGMAVIMIGIVLFSKAEEA